METNYPEIINYRFLLSTWRISAFKPLFEEVPRYFEEAFELTFNDIKVNYEIVYGDLDPDDDDDKVDSHILIDTSEPQIIDDGRRDGSVNRGSEDVGGGGGGYDDDGGDGIDGEDNVTGRAGRDSEASRPGRPGASSGDDGSRDDGGGSGSGEDGEDNQDIGPEAAASSTAAATATVNTRPRRRSSTTSVQRHEFSTTHKRKATMKGISGWLFNQTDQIPAAGSWDTTQMPPIFDWNTLFDGMFDGFVARCDNGHIFKSVDDIMEALNRDADWQTIKSRESYFDEFYRTDYVSLGLPHIDSEYLEIINQRFVNPTNISNYHTSYQLSALYYHYNFNRIYLSHVFNQGSSNMNEKFNVPACMRFLGIFCPTCYFDFLFDVFYGKFVKPLDDAYHAKKAPLYSEILKAHKNIRKKILLEYGNPCLKFSRTFNLQDAQDRQQFQKLKVRGGIFYSKNADNDKIRLLKELKCVPVADPTVIKPIENTIYKLEYISGQSATVTYTYGLPLTERMHKFYRKLINICVKTYLNANADVPLQLTLSRITYPKYYFDHEAEFTEAGQPVNFSNIPLYLMIHMDSYAASDPIAQMKKTLDFTRLHKIQEQSATAAGTGSRPQRKRFIVDESQ
jgi:hypothetical protein